MDPLPLLAIGVDNPRVILVDGVLVYKPHHNVENEDDQQDKFKFLKGFDNILSALILNRAGGEVKILLITDLR